jgi:hypothetical protein
MTIGLRYTNTPIAKPAPKNSAIVSIAPTEMPSIHQPPVPSAELEAAIQHLSQFDIEWFIGESNRIEPLTVMPDILYQ